MKRKLGFAKTQGFTLIELLIVLAVIGILISIALPRFRGMQDEGNIAKAKGELRTLQTAIESFYIHNNQTYPANLTVLTTQNPRVITTVPTDPFSTTSVVYGYVRGGTNNKYFVTFSVGPGQNGSATIGTGAQLDQVVETNGQSCIYVSNASVDTAP